LIRKLPVRQIAAYLRAKERLVAVNSFSTSPAGFDAQKPLAQWLRSVVGGRAEAKRANHVMRALTLLSSLEFISRTPFYEFSEQDPPIDRDTIATFVKKHGRYLLLPRFAPAVFFIARYMPSQDPLPRQRRPAEAIEWRMTFGEVSSFVELTEHFVNDDRMHSFLAAVYRYYLSKEEGIHQWSDRALGSVPSQTRETVVSARQLSAGRITLLAGTTGLPEFFEFTLNLGIVAGIASNRRINDNLFEALRSCFFPWYADSLALKTLFGVWWKKFDNQEDTVQESDATVEGRQELDPSGEGRDLIETFETTVNGMAIEPASALSPKLARKIIETWQS